MGRTVKEIDVSLTRSSERLAWARITEDHVSAEIERRVIDRLLDERNNAELVTA